MLSRTPVQSDEMSAIARKYGTPKAGCEGKLVGIGDGSICLSSLRSRKYIVAKPASPSTTGKGKSSSA
jgi:hypothetical protein